METKICTICQSELPVNDDYWYYYKSPLTGIKYPKSNCKECEKARVAKFQREHYVPKPRVKKPPKEKIVTVKQKSGRKPKEIPPTKVCNMCNREYENTSGNFPLHNIKAKGKAYLKNWCRSCDRIKRAEIRAKNPEAVKAQKKRHHERHKDKINARTRKWYENNPEKAKENKKKYYEENKEEIFFKVNQRYHRKRANGGSFTQAEIDQLYVDQQGLCAYCKCDISGGYHKDHVIPVSKNGSNNIDNIALACSKCNSSKHDNTPDEWTNRWYIA